MHNVLTISTWAAIVLWIREETVRNEEEKNSSKTVRQFQSFFRSHIIYPLGLHTLEEQGRLF